MFRYIEVHRKYALMKLLVMGSLCWVRWHATEVILCSCWSKGRIFHTQCFVSCDQSKVNKNYGLGYFNIENNRANKNQTFYFSEYPIYQVWISAKLFQRYDLVYLVRLYRNAWNYYCPKITFWMSGKLMKYLWWLKFKKKSKDIKNFFSKICFAFFVNFVVFLKKNYVSIDEIQWYFRLRFLKVLEPIRNSTVGHEKKWKKCC